MYILKDRVNRIDILRKNIKDNQEDLDTEKGRFNGFVYDIKLAIKEFKYVTRDNRLEYLDAILSRALNNVAKTTIGEEMKDFLEALGNEFEDVDTLINLSTPYAGFNTINDRIISTLVPNINNSNRPFTVFDPMCLNGYLLRATKEFNKNAVLYGLEENNSQAQRAKEIADRVIKGTLRGSRISNDVFDMVYAVCHINTILEDNMSVGAVVKTEKTYIINMLKYLRNDGIAMITIPFYRLHKDICSMLAKQLTNVSIIKGMGDDEDRGFVYIIGQKRKSREEDIEIYETLRKCYNYNNVPYVHEVEINSFNLPNRSLDIDIFKGSVLDEDELLNIVQHSGCVDAFFDKQKVRKIHENTIQPLLPFNVGQIGLVLTSGCLDGVIDEGDGHYHLVKGRVSKKKDTERNVSDGVVEETEVISNRVEINVILPSGEFKTLA
jgi:hypothetical protein